MTFFILFMDRIREAYKTGNFLTAMHSCETKRHFCTLAATLESVATVAAMAAKLAGEAGLDEDARFGITLAAHEAAANAVLHGSKGDPSRQITASFENTGASLIITIADRGDGVNAEHIPDPLTTKNLLRETGRGIFLMRFFMDEVRFRSLHPGTELTLVQYLGITARNTLPAQKNTSKRL